jgi:hypothetical protein
MPKRTPQDWETWSGNFTPPVSPPVRTGPCGCRSPTPPRAPPHSSQHARPRPFSAAGDAVGIVTYLRAGDYGRGRFRHDT